MVDDRYDLGWLVGRTLAEVNGSEHGSWQFGFGPDAGVRADCPWRVIRDGRIVLSSEDHGQQYGLPAPVDAEAECRRLIGGAVVAGAEVRDETRDFVIRFASGTRLELVPLSSGYESWQLGGPGGSLVIAQGGGQLAIWHALNAEPGAAAGGGGG